MAEVKTGCGVDFLRRAAREPSSFGAAGWCGRSPRSEQRAKKKKTECEVDLSRRRWAVVWAPGMRRPFSGGLARASSSLGAADGEGESRFRGRPVVAEVGGAGALLVRSGGWRRRVVLGSAAVLFQCGAGFGSAAALSGRCGRSPRSPRSEQRAEAGGGTQTHRGVVDA